MVLMGLGSGEITGSLLIGYIKDHSNDKITTLICLFFSTISILINMAYTWYYDFSFIFAFFMCFMYGV